ncbi:MAG: hypothetical protein ACREEP_01865, partial [Dongiaceae bacterium]
MSPLDDRAARVVEPGAAADERRMSPRGPVEGEVATASSRRQFDEIPQSQLAAELETATNGADPVSGVESAVRTAAEGLGYDLHEPSDFAPESDRGAQMETAVDVLVRAALEMDDPVAALDQGADALAEALAARDIATREQLHAARERRIDEQAAHRHARLHRVTELIDVGYSLDAQLLG